MTARPAFASEPVTVASVLTLLAGVERHGPDAPAALAFKSALRRAGIEADAAGRLQSLDELLQAVAEADLERADARTAIIRAAWGELLPGPAGREQPGAAGSSREQPNPR